jgi:hypothetical protein
MRAIHFIKYSFIASLHALLFPSFNPFHRHTAAPYAKLIMPPIHAVNVKNVEEQSVLTAVIQSLLEHRDSGVEEQWGTEYADEFERKFSRIGGRFQSKNKQIIRRSLI